MEKMNTGLKLLLRFLLLLVAVSSLLGLIEIQEYRTVDTEVTESDLADKVKKGQYLPTFTEIQILEKTTLRTHYRVLVKFQGG